MSQDNQTSRRVGERLRQARDQQGISVAEAAERLHILPSYVHAMENGRYNVLPGTVFLRGYVRSYARMLRLNEDEVVAQLDRELGSNDVPPLKGHVIPKGPHTSARRNVLLLLVAVVLAVGAVVFTQRDRFLAPEPVASPSEPESLSDVPLAEEITPGRSEPDPVAPEKSEPATSDGPARIEIPLSAEPAQPQNNTVADSHLEPAARPQDSAELSSRVPVEDSPVAEQPSEIVTPAAADSIEPAAEPPPAAEPVREASSQVTSTGLGDDRLVVQFTGDCWFELTDADGERKRGMFHAGDTLVYEGTAPFKVVVGAASETSMRFNGVPVDYSQYRVWNNRVGMTLGQ